MHTFYVKNAKGIVKDYKKYAIETDKSPNYGQKTIETPDAGCRWVKNKKDDVQGANVCSS